jgi:hypothetical protein
MYNSTIYKYIYMYIYHFQWHDCSPRTLQMELTGVRESSSSSITGPVSSQGSVPEATHMRGFWGKSTVRSTQTIRPANRDPSYYWSTEEKCEFSYLPLKTVFFTSLCKHCGRKGTDVDHLFSMPGHIQWHTCYAEACLKASSELRWKRTQRLHSNSFGKGKFCGIEIISQ